MALGKQVRMYRQALGWTLEDLENRSGVLRGTISALENRDSSKSEHAANIAKAFGLTVDQLVDESRNWLEYYNLASYEQAPRQAFVRESGATYGFPSQEETFFTLHHYDAGGRMGNGGLEMRDQPGVIQSWRVSKDWLQQNVKAHSSNANLCIVTGFGDSMQPMFNPGDPLLVDTGVISVEFDSVYFFRVGKEGYIKRLQRIPTEDGLVIRAISENKVAYEPFSITEKMDFQVLGRVLKVWRSQEF